MSDPASSVPNSTHDLTSVAAEIHDSLLPLLFAARMRIEVLSSQVTDQQQRQELLLTLDHLQHAMEVGRLLLADMFFADATALDWQASLQAVHRQFAGPLGTLTVEGDFDRFVHDPQKRMAARRIAHEAIRNALRHAQADAIQVRCHRLPDGIVTVQVQNDGPGFDPTVTGEGYGLRIIRARAQKVGGSVALQSQPSGPTSLTFSVTP